MQNLQNSNDMNENKDAAAGSLKHTKEPGTNEKIIQKVLEIERDADHIHDKAVHEAEQLPVRADQEAQTIIDKARGTAQADANKLLDQAKVAEQGANILAEADKAIQHSENLASGNFSRAVAYVVARVIGRE